MNEEEYLPFSVVRERKGAGPDKRGDTFFVEAKANEELVMTGDSPESCLITGFLGGDRSEAVRLTDMLNEAWKKFHNG